VECGLNVLLNNPEHSLYARLGFSSFQVMARPMTNDPLIRETVAAP